MALQELLWFIFSDEFIASLLFPINDKYVLNSALTIREDINIFHVILIALLGGLIGSIFNYIFGRLLSNGFNLKLQITKKIEFTLIISLILLPFGFFGTLASFLSGAMRMKAKYFIITSTIIYILWGCLKLAFHTVFSGI